MELIKTISLLCSYSMILWSWWIILLAGILALNTDGMLVGHGIHSSLSGSVNLRSTDPLERPDPPAGWPWPGMPSSHYNKTFLIGCGYPWNAFVTLTPDDRYVLKKESFPGRKKVCQAYKKSCTE